MRRWRNRCRGSACGGVPGRDQRRTVARSIRYFLFMLVCARWRPPTASILLPREGQEAKSVEGICREGLGGPVPTGRACKLSDRSMQPLATVRGRIASGVPGVRGHSRVASSVPILAPLSATSPSAVETHPAPGLSRTNDLRSGIPAAATGLNVATGFDVASGGVGARRRVRPRWRRGVREATTGPPHAR
jgi:hypothetical protein